MPAAPSRTPPDLDPVVEPLETICRRGHARQQVFDDWLTLMLAALERDDDRYMDVMAGYNERDRDHHQPSAELFSEAFGGLQAVMSETNRDVVGAAYMAMGADSDGFGQHFTPTSVCEAIAEMTMTVEGDDEEAAGEDGDDRPHILDPACGSGRLLMAASRRHPDGWFVGVDKDAMCAKMAALNCCLFNLDARVVHGDSLRVEAHQVWETRGTILGGEVAKREPGEAAAEILAAAQDATEPGEPGEPAVERADHDADEADRAGDVDAMEEPAAEAGRELRQLSLEDALDD